jgi:predicted AlkP superfamily pyrophosphatase or phosphodiesterase
MPQRLRSKFSAATVYFLALVFLPTPRLSAQMLPQMQAPQSPALVKVIEVANAPNSPEQQAKPYVVLVSLDGFRYDYVAKYTAPNIAAMMKRGSSAPDGMYPVYPSVTFPSHLSIITGLYPEHHGIVANSFYDPARQQRYTYADRSTVTDGTWYSGVPLWSLAEQNKMRSACFFWPGSEAEIAGKRPSYYVAFDPLVPNDQRVAQVLAWLRLPPAERPHFITLYMAEVDGAGHAFGPDSQQVADAVKSLDAEVGKLIAGLDATHLPVDLVVLADHGMDSTRGNWINLDQLADLSHFKTDGSFMYPPSEAEAAKAYQSLTGASDKFKVYRRADVPAGLHFDSNPRAGDPIVVSTGPFAIRAHTPGPGEPNRPPPVGQHGYDPRLLPTMKALFVAMGPDIRAGITVPPFENVNVYPLIAQILALPIPKIDGDVKVLQVILKSPPKN